MKKLIKTEELARLMDVHPHTVRLWAKEGRIPYIKLSERDFRYDYDDVIAKLEVK